MRVTDAVVDLSLITSNQKNEMSFVNSGAGLVKQSLECRSTAYYCAKR